MQAKVRGTSQPSAGRPSAGGRVKAGADGVAGHHAPRKRFGQHFLVDHTVIDAIVRLIAPEPGQVMVEIGPGLGAMTQPLVERLGHLAVIELDRDLAARLRARADLRVVQADVLTVDFTALRDTLQAGTASAAAGPAQRRLRVVGNLPYNISTPILFHLLDHVDAIEDQHFMLQKEVVDRMVAAPDSAAYGRLSVMLQWRYAMDDVLHVPPESFSPPPRVDSSVVSMRPRVDAPPVDVDLLSTIVQVAFSQRRKLMRHTLGRWLDARGYTGAFDLQRRAQEVPVHEFLALAASA
ncbi:MAG: 16S rRNA (adenine(1518)-N(6)/adenine(1519)-N(6))-dimethyltransferase RsmA [Rhodoferax sp.]|nr:16S rRNA (adenine(1518)-N(6)/adenine(1519)-N(6))-dimethyltransferase RsmA [Rhodoferax sp.]MCB2007939.1 16S rRNA (adenine(1518)-N(6)/adenine(1519)-N(6))-dimethyltransferase RsmA [Rhodoferax sp.]MCB2030522.1 16S rRNA (adenine(1518)-N(6)/adenine(1519)-N(6))-dimethyltransferase RsmA [Rhodoferax sp.]MCB2039936.1 16S rRNA (adenine(1518)-N(6)/adenine(1519)-N(6))-dimethyltransferase RsmA [Rhodoferax sp.]MCP5264088.1 16S rRNA (adenine(1518)-N(6)/adenine(1519)-N(6))-dimethyltransferase RsmA [Rhodofera